MLSSGTFRNFAGLSELGTDVTDRLKIEHASLLRSEPVLPQLAPPVEHITKATVKPAFASRIVAPAVDVFVNHVRVVAAEARDFLLQTMLCVLHERGVATMPELAMLLD